MYYLNDKRVHIDLSGGFISITNLENDLLGKKKKAYDIIKTVANFLKYFCYK